LIGQYHRFIKHRLGIAAVHRTDKTGQFVLEVEKPADNADAVFEEAQAA
jgi:hypothetical protein